MAGTTKAWSLVDLVGQRFGRWTVIERSSPPRKGPVLWLCRCDCGAEKVRYGSSLRNGTSKSCGCMKNESTSARMIKHQHARRGHKTPEYIAWCNMHKRCNNSNGADFNDYGGRGINVCKRWTIFENFLKDMGEKPSGTSLDRIDVNGSYEPGNCRWATASEQARNTRKSRRYEYNGETLTAFDWAERFGVNKNTMKARLSRGISVADAAACGRTR